MASSVTSMLMSSLVDIAFQAMTYVSDYGTELEGPKLRQH